MRTRKAVVEIPVHPPGGYMFCKFCGRAIADNLAFCDGCGADVNSGGAATARSVGQQLTNEVKARSLDAWRGVKLFARSPVGGLQDSYALFDDRRAIQVGIVFAVVYEIGLMLGAYIFKSKAAELTQGLIPVGDLTAGQFVKLLFLGLIPFVSLVGACALARVIFRGKGKFAGDVYTAGAVLLPSGFLVLAASLLGPANVEVIVILALFALTYSILILYAGCSRIGSIAEAGAAPAVPVILLLSAWITKVIVIATW
jgi:hypothetical protein